MTSKIFYKGLGFSLSCLGAISTIDIPENQKTVAWVQPLICFIQEQG